MAFGAKASNVLWQLAFLNACLRFNLGEEIYLDRPAGCHLTNLLSQQVGTAGPPVTSGRT